MKYIVIGLLLLLLTTTAFAGELHTVKRVVDGDTIILENDERVRLIGVDTPEIHESPKLHKDVERTGKDIETIKEQGSQASEYVKSLCEGKEIELEYDNANAHVNHRDKYGRLLAYVYVSFDNWQDVIDKAVVDFDEDALGVEAHMTTFDSKRHKVDLNRSVIRYGYGHAYTKYPFAYQKNYLKLEKEARKEGRGLWGEN